MKLSAVTRNHVQDIVNQLMATSAAPSTVRNAILPLRAIYRRAHQRDDVATNPTSDSPCQPSTSPETTSPAPTKQPNSSPASTSRPGAVGDHYTQASPRRATRLALVNIDLEHDLIRVERSGIASSARSNPRPRPPPPPLAQTLRRHLVTHHLHQPPNPLDLVYTTPTGNPFNPTATINRPRTAWNRGLTPINLHECRHTYASFMIAAGINPKALSAYMGGAGITITLDRYGHLFPETNTKQPRSLTPTSTTPSKPPNDPHPKTPGSE